MNQAVPAVRCKAQAEMLQSSRGQAPAQKIGKAPFSFGRIELFHIEPGAFGAQGNEPFPLLPIGGPGVFGDFHSHLGGQMTHRFGEGHVFHLHDEVDNPASGAAAKAMVDLLIPGHREGGCFFVVEGTQAKVVGAAFFQLHIPADDVINVASCGEFLQKTFW